jgi:anti-anti-sigma regulatory factor
VTATDDGTASISPSGDFTVSLEERDGVAIVTVRGRFDLDAAWVAGRCVRTARHHGATELVIDMRRVHTTTGAALDSVLQSLGALIASGVDVDVLAPAPAPVRAVS